MGETCSSTHREKVTALAVDSKRNAEARVTRSPRTWVRNPPDSAAAFAPRKREIESPPSVLASGT